MKRKKEKLLFLSLSSQFLLRSFPPQFPQLETSKGDVGNHTGRKCAYNNDLQGYVQKDCQSHPGILQ